MFRDKNLFLDEMLDLWKLAHNIPIDNVEKCHLPKICMELNALVTTQSVNRRLSLRASSSFIGGAAKMYRQSLDKLYDDVIKLNEDFTHRRRRRRERERLDSSSSESADSMAGSMFEAPEQMRRSAIVGIPDSSFSPTKRHRTESMVKMTPRITMSRPSCQSLRNNVTTTNEEDSPGQSSDEGNEVSEHMGINSNSCSEVNHELDMEEPFSEEENAESQRKDKGVQTSPILTSRKRNINRLEDHGFDRNLPFGYILIHDNYGSRMPTAPSGNSSQ